MRLGLRLRVSAVEGHRLRGGGLASAAPLHRAGPLRPTPPRHAGQATAPQAAAPRRGPGHGGRRQRRQRLGEGRARQRGAGRQHAPLLGALRAVRSRRSPLFFYLV
eukprot:scaffold98801_cov42-Phaeocystis_antarctica.AAC.2